MNNKTFDVPLQFNHVFRKDVYESNIDFPCYIIVEGVGLNQKIKVEYRDGQELSEDIRKDVLEQFSNHNNQSELKKIENESPKKFVRIQLRHPGYDVPADRKDMIDMAVDALYDDVMGAVKHNEMGEWIELVDSDATEVDIPSFITEICDDEENV